MRCLWQYDVNKPLNGSSLQISLSKFLKIHSILALLVSSFFFWRKKSCQNSISNLISPPIFEKPTKILHFQFIPGICHHNTTHPPLFISSCRATIVCIPIVSLTRHRPRSRSSSAADIKRRHRLNPLRRGPPPSPPPSAAISSSVRRHLLRRPPPSPPPSAAISAAVRRHLLLIKKNKINNK